MWEKHLQRGIAKQNTNKHPKTHLQETMERWSTSMGTLNKKHVKSWIPCAVDSWNSATLGTTHLVNNISTTRSAISISRSWATFKDQFGTITLVLGFKSCSLWCQYGCFLKWWYPQNTPKWSFLVGRPLVVGYHTFLGHPHMFEPDPDYTSWDS